MFIKMFSGLLMVCFLAGSAIANTYIEYTLDGDWIYEEECEGTLSLSENPSGGITATINVPSGCGDGGLTASRHDLPGFALDNNIFLELEYSSLESAITGTTVWVSLCLEVEFFDSQFNRYEISMAFGYTNELRMFATWFQDDGNFEYHQDKPIPAGLSIDDGTFGLYFHDNYVSAYFKDEENNFLYPFSDWDISQIVGAYDFRVDNDFEAGTLDGGTVSASVNLEQVVYGPSSAQNWTQVNNDGFRNSSMEDARCMVVYKDKLYVGTATEAFGETCQVWRTAAVGGPPFTDWQQVNTDGFEDDDNIGILCLVVYDNFLYAGVENKDTGCEVWRTAAVGGPPFTDWQQVNTNGFGDSKNELIGSMVVFNGNLYVGIPNETTGCEIWRTAAVGGPPFTDWEQVNTDGFGDAKNGEAESLTTYNSNLYVAVGNESSGCQIWRTAAVGGPPFADWQQVNTHGFGDLNNKETFGIVVFNDYLYIGTENETTGGEVWRTAAVGGPPFTDWQQANTDGFGDANNAGAALGVVYNNRLYAGTSNRITGCEVWQYPAVVCECDFDTDGDVDGSDLATFAGVFNESTLPVFAAEFGRTNCLE